jgi:hypothetical protein
MKIFNYTQYIKETFNDAYNFNSTNDFLIYEFTSSGKTLINRVVVFSETEFKNIYNLGQGIKTTDDDGTFYVDYDTETNNNDMKELFSTIFKIILMFNINHPNNIIYIKGNTYQKIKIYNFLLSRHKNKINKKFYLYGIINGDMIHFNKYQDFESIVLIPKK